MSEDDWYTAKVVHPDDSKEDVDAGAQPHLNALAGFVNKRTRATLTDGRVLSGTFICFDYQGNVLINHAEEERFTAADATNSHGALLVSFIV
ncbi:hypothetical protein T484DRAFT_1782123 [Baffinella frigidus]|nr:hypothetical protein T484DRAFT_1782123 [Cryptophyta sp. CCMP2293]